MFCVSLFGDERASSKPEEDEETDDEDESECADNDACDYT